MAFHHRNGVTVNVSPRGARSRVRVKAPGMDTFHFFSSDVADANRRLHTEAEGLEHEGYADAAAALRELADEVFPS